MTQPRGVGGSTPVSTNPVNDGDWLNELRELISQRAAAVADEQAQARGAGAQQASLVAPVLEREGPLNGKGFTNSSIKTTSPRPSPRHKPAPRPLPKPHSSVATGTKSDGATSATMSPKGASRPKPARGTAKVRSLQVEGITPAAAPKNPNINRKARGVASVRPPKPAAGSEQASQLQQAVPQLTPPKKQPSPVPPLVPSIQEPPRPAVSHPELQDSTEPRLGARHRQDQPLTPTPRLVSRTTQSEPVARRMVRSAGELLITLGLVVMLFAGYEVYGKTWEINAEQDRLTSALDHKWDKAGAQTPVADDPIPGEGIARLHIPVLGKKWVVVQGVTLDDIKRAPGHYPDSQMPDKLGNFAVAGHRTPAIFWDLDKLSTGDAIVVETSTQWYIYRVSSSTIVLPTKTDVVSANPDKPGTAPTDKLITLTTCNPKWDNYQRLIIHGKQVRSQPKSQGRPNELGT